MLLLLPNLGMGGSFPAAEAVEETTSGGVAMLDRLERERYEQLDMLVHDDELILGIIKQFFRL